LFKELQTFSNRAKKKNVMEFIQFLPNFPIFRKKRTFPEVLGRFVTPAMNFSFQNLVAMQFLRCVLVQTKRQVASLVAN
jgi:hypothetical protein